MKEEKAVDCYSTSNNVVIVLQGKAVCLLPTRMIDKTSLHTFH